MEASETELEFYRYEKLAEEAKNKYARTNKTFTETRNRSFVLLTFELGVISYFTTYFFGNALENIPMELYGRIVFGAAYAAILASLGVLLVSYKSIFDWPSPIGPIEREKIKNAKTKLEVTKIIEEDYRQARDDGEKIMKKRAEALNLSMHIFIISAIILLIIRIF